MLHRMRHMAAATMTVSDWDDPYEEDDDFAFPENGGIRPDAGTALTFVDAIRAEATETGQTSEAVTW